MNIYDRRSEPFLLFLFSFLIWKARVFALFFFFVVAARTAFESKKEKEKNDAITPAASATTEGNAPIRRLRHVPSFYANDVASSGRTDTPTPK